MEVVGLISNRLHLRCNIDKLCSPLLDCRPLKGESGVEPFRTFLLGGATGALKVEASAFGGSGGRKTAGCSIIA